MQVSIEALSADLVALLVAHGAPREEAAVAAEGLLDAEMRAHRSHGVRLLRNVVAEYGNGRDRRGAHGVRHETPVSAQYDGGFHVSLFVHRAAVDIAIDKALSAGIAIVSVCNAGVSGALGHLVERIADAGLVGIAANSSPATVVAPGSAVPALGTNPLAIGVPRATGRPLVLDMATSSISYNEILRLEAAGEPLPAGVATDSAGEPTTDPTSAIDSVSRRGRILPFGGHRGYGLALMIELLVSAGATGRVAGDKRGAVLAEPADFSGIYLAYQPALVGDPSVAGSAVERLLGELGEQGARLPGETGRMHRQQCLREGVIELNDDAIAVLDAVRAAAP